MDGQATRRFSIYTGYAALGALLLGAMSSFSQTYIDFSAQPNVDRGLKTNLAAGKIESQTAPSYLAAAEPILSDDFNASTLDLSKWRLGTNTGNQSAVVNNALELRSQGYENGWVVTRNAYTGRNTTITVKVLQPSNEGDLGISPTYNLSATYGIADEANRYRFYIYREGSSGNYRLYVDWRKNGILGGFDVTGNLVITGMVYLRLRCDDTDIHFEASLDGVTWTETYNETFALPGYTLNSPFYYELTGYKTWANGTFVVDDFSITSQIIDTQPPQINAVNAQNLTSSSAQIIWQTDEAADSQVEYGLTASYGYTTPLSANFVLAHAVALSGLAANTTYHYRVKSKDPSGNLAIAGDFVFSTPTWSTQFVDITASAGVSGISEFGGHAIVFAEVNGDAFVDMYVTHTNFDPNNAGEFLVLPDELYINNGNNTFSERAVAAGVDDPGQSHGAVFVDIDNDGDFDLFNGQRGPSGNRLYRNDGSGIFTDITATAGILLADRHTIGVLALDIEHDGDMDLFSANWSVANEMYVNDGTGKFSVQERGVTDIDPDPHGTMAATAADVDNDGDLDIFMAKRVQNGSDACKLYINDGRGYFTDQAAARGVAYSGDVNGAVFGDLDWDGDLDMVLASSALDRSNPITKLRIYRNPGNGFFIDETNLHNIDYDGYTVNAGDLDNDGDLDIFIYINSGTGTVLLNDGTGHFTPQTNAGFNHVAKDARAGTLTDIDADGDLDVAIAHINEGTWLYRNELNTIGTPAQNYLQIALTGADGRVGLFGSKFYLYETGHLDDPAYLRGYQQLTSSLGTLSQNSPLAHFGVSSSKNYDLRVKLLDGNSIVQTNITPGQRLHLQTISDTTPPITSNVAASNITTSSTTITWTTNESSDTQVEYGLTTSYGSSSPLNASLVTSHTMTLSSLQANTTYHYRVKSRDAAGNLATSSDFTFTTLAPVLPVISSFSPTSGSVGTQVTIAGSNFTGATSVAFNGTAAASFTVDSNSQIRAAVPTGATTGKISVMTAAGGATSADDFAVITTLAFGPTDDAYVQSSSPTRNYGTSSQLRVRKTSSTEQNTYLKFNISGLSGSVQSAKLRLYVADAGNDGGAIYNVSNNYLGTSTPWLESGLRWNNAPTISGSPLASAGAVSVKQTVELDVTATITANGVYSFAIRNNSSNTVSYRSKQGNNPPELIIQTANAAAMVAGETKSNEPAIERSSHVIFASDVPEDFALLPNYPNPLRLSAFNAETRLVYQLPERAQVRLALYDVLGREVMILVDAMREPGTHQVMWNGRDAAGALLPSGIYIYRLVTPRFSSSQRLLLIK